MAVNEPQDTPGVEDILSSAVERQLTEQRALRETLGRIEEGVGALREEVAGSTETVAGSILEALQAVRARLDRPERDTLSPAREDLESIRSLLEEQLARMPESLFRGVRDALAPQFGVPDGLRTQLDDLRVAVDGSGRDVEALAQSLLELNSGLRQWADRTDERIDSLAERLVGGLRELGTVQDDTLQVASRRISEAAAHTGQEVRDAVREAIEPLDSRLGGVEEQLVEAGEISRYLHDQAEDLDRILGTIGDVPKRLDGVVSQALRRSLTARAGLIREAEKALERTIGPVESSLERLVASLEGVADLWEEGNIPDDIRKLSLRQVELTSRLDDLQETLLTSLESAAEERRERDEALAAAIDRLASGRDPEAARALADAVGAGGGQGSPRGRGRAKGGTVAGRKGSSTAKKQKRSPQATKTAKATSKTAKTAKTGAGKPAARSSTKRGKAGSSKGSSSKGSSTGTRPTRGGGKRSSGKRGTTSDSQGRPVTSSEAGPRRSSRTTTRATNYIPV